MNFSLTFLGGAQTVTGSKFLLQAGASRILIDCGLFQGLKDLRLKNWAEFPVSPRSIDAVIVTHAHLDHIGYLPLLVKQGFKGTIWSTAPTRSLAEIILLDASHIQEEDARRAQEEGYSKHSPPRPLFTTEEARTAMQHFRSLNPDKWLEISPHLRFRFISSGHILGSAFVEIDHKGTRLLFTGDLGRRKPLLLHPRRAIREADYLIMESTYGDRLHPKETVLHSLSRCIRETLSRGGDVLIPSFAVGRSQDVLYLLAQLKKQKQIPAVPIYFDSPMGVQATKALTNFPEWHRLGGKEIRELSETAIIVSSLKQSFELSRSRKQKIVIAGSGMLTGGRILNYLEKALPDARNTVLLVGYQAAGTRGRLLRDRVPEIKLHGEFINVRSRVEEIPGLSAHADQGEILSWLGHFQKAPRQVFLVHGEPQPLGVLRLKIENVFGWKCYAPQPGETLELKPKKKRR